MGRFISQDPEFWKISTGLPDPQLINSYSYARNNPLAYNDPDGKWFKDVIMGRQLWNDFVVEVGEASNYLYDNSSAWKTAMDDPYATGAVVGVVGGATAVVGAAAVPVVAPYAQSAATTTGRALFNPQAIVRGTINAGLNVAGQAIDDKITGNQTSAGDYAKTIGLSYAGGALFGGRSKSVTVPVLGAGATNALTQRVTGDKKVDPVKVGSSMLGTGFGSWAGNYLGQTSNLGLYSAQQYGLGRIGWTVETPINVFNAGFRRKAK